ncbi:MAG: 50S ribosomal protein L18a [Candidatus Heimdallarchaeota archaeon]|nr:50S ribosomal protein L18a [Candidatus Heimdallarchaeota archaeon]MCK4955243.1 50S ribosomal protein L18a [Candidatus Heimdallarchaeota archaeon]
MSVKTYHIRGKFKKRKRTIPFGKYVRAVSKEDALDQIYSVIGSQHKVKRNVIFIDKKDIKEITDPEEIKDSVIKSFASEDGLQIPKRK